MQINILGLLNNQVDAIDLEREIAPEDWGFSGQRMEQVQTSFLTANLTVDAPGRLRLTGRLKTTVAGPCARCLEAAEQTLDVALDECFEEASGRSDDIPSDCYERGDKQLDLLPALRDNLVLAMPQRLLCQASCRGLCPICGGNRNQTDCSCLEAQARNNSVFSQLKQYVVDEPSRSQTEV